MVEKIKIPVKVRVGKKKKEVGALKRGFTLMELLIVVIIIGILAAIGLPQFFKVAERGRAAEAVALLGSLRSAQIRYAAEHGTTTSSLDDLDVEYTPLKFFNTPTLTGGVNPRTALNKRVAAIRRNNNQNVGFGNYRLAIEADGDITCTGTGNTCKNIGYP